MVAFNFKEQFATKIVDGSKWSTIRDKQRCKVGDKIQLYVGQRTKNCRKLLDAECTGTGRITIAENGSIVLRDAEGSPTQFPLHVQEGFDGHWTMVSWFHENKGGLPYTGYIHAWKPTVK